MTSITKDYIFTNLKITDTNKVPNKIRGVIGEPGEIILEGGAFYGWTGTQWQLFSSGVGLSQVLAVGNDAGGLNMTGLNNVVSNGTIYVNTLALPGDLNAGNIYNVNTITASLFVGEFTGVATNVTQIAGADINGVLFTGASNITIQFAAENVYGSTLNSTVSSSSLEKLGILNGLTMAGDIDSNSVTTSTIAGTNLTGNSLQVENVFSTNLMANFLQATLFNTTTATITNLISSTIVGNKLSTNFITVTLANIATASVINLTTGVLSAATLTATNLTASLINAQLVKATTSSFNSATLSALYAINFYGGNSTFTTMYGGTLVANSVLSTNVYGNTITATILNSTTATLNSIITNSIVTVTLTGSTILGNWNGSLISPLYGGTGRSTWSQNGVLWASASTIISETNTVNNGILATNASSVPFLSLTLPLQVQDNITYLGTIQSTLNMGGNNIINANVTTASLFSGNLSSFERVSGNSINPNVLNTIVQSVAVTLANPTFDSQEKWILSTVGTTINPITFNNVTNTTLTVYNNANGLDLIWDAVNQTWINKSNVIRLAPGSYSDPSVSFLQNTTTGVFQSGVSQLGLTTGGVNAFNISSTGNITTPYNCGFMGYLANAITFTGGTVDNLIARYDRNSNFSAGGIFTAPLTGAYAFNGLLTMGSLTASHTSCTLTLFKNSSPSNYLAMCNPYALANTLGEATISFNSINYLIGGDTINLNLNVTSTTLRLLGNEATFFAGYLIG